MDARLHVLPTALRLVVTAAEGPLTLTASARAYHLLTPTTLSRSLGRRLAHTVGAYLKRPGARTKIGVRLLALRDLARQAPDVPEWIGAVEAALRPAEESQK